MKSRYRNEAEIAELVRSFEDASVARGVWKHAEHLIVALYYLENDELEAATEKMRAGLFVLLTDGFEVDFTKEMPYHETLTVFWMRTVEEFRKANSGMPLAAKAKVLVEVYDKDYPLKFYSRERLFSDAARSEFIEPELTGQVRL